MKITQSDGTIHYVPVDLLADYKENTYPEPADATPVTSRALSEPRTSTPLCTTPENSVAPDLCQIMGAPARKWGMKKLSSVCQRRYRPSSKTSRKTPATIPLETNHNLIDPRLVCQPTRSPHLMFDRVVHPDGTVIEWLYEKQ